MRYILLLPLLAASVAYAQPIRELVAPPGRIKLDGRLDEAVWRKTPQTEPFLLMGSRTAVAPRQTRARALLGRGVIYLGFEVDEPQVDLLTRTVRPHDGAIWREDAIEVMLQPVPGSPRYFHFAFTPAGSRYDGMAGTAAPAGDWHPKPDWKVAVAKLADRWQAEVAIPIKALGVEPPLTGELWGLKLCRTIVGRGGNRDGDYNSSWSYQPSVSYHDPMGWGRLYFIDKNSLRNEDLAMKPRPNGLPAYWREQLVWRKGQPPTGKVDQAVVDGNAAVRLTKFATAKGSLLPRATTVSLVRGGRRFRVSARVKAKGQVLLSVSMYAGRKHASISWPFELKGDAFETVTKSFANTEKGHAVAVTFSLGRKTVGELLVREVSLVDEGPPPQPPIAVDLNHGLTAACENLVDMKPHGLLRDAKGWYRFERLIFRDQGTGVPIWRITSDASPANAIYSNRYPWNVDGSAYKLATWGRPGAPYMIVAPDGSALRGAGASGNLRWSRDPDWLVYTTRDTLSRYNWRTGERKTLYTVPASMKHGGRGRLVANLDLPGAVYYEQAFGLNAPLYFIDLKTGKHTRLPLTSDSKGNKAKDWLYSAGLYRARNGVWWVRYSINHLPHLSDRNPYQQRVSSLGGKIGMDRLTLDRPKGKPAQPLYSHGGTQPSQRYETGFSNGGICLWNFDTWSGKMLVPGPQDGHISWEYLDDWFFAGTCGRALSGPFASLLLKVYTDGTWYKVAYGNTVQNEYNTNLFANISPDGTKGSFSSTMLGPVDLFWCVISYPDPPVNVSVSQRGGKAILTWRKPAKSREIAGCNVYRSDRSGTGFARLNDKPVGALTYTDPRPGAAAFYVVTSVERSGLESRAPSAEVAVGDLAGRPERLFVEAERGALTAPLRENLHGSASNQLFVDYREGEGRGRATYRFTCRRRTPHTL